MRGILHELRHIPDALSSVVYTEPRTHLSPCDSWTFLDQSRLRQPLRSKTNWAEPEHDMIGGYVVRGDGGPVPYIGSLFSGSQSPQSPTAAQQTKGRLRVGSDVGGTLCIYSRYF